LQMIAKSVAASEAYNLAWGEFSKSLEPDVPVPVQQNRPVKLVSKDDIDRTLRLAQPHATDLERSKMVDILFRLTNI